jgi:hypothetical protein
VSDPSLFSEVETKLFSDISAYIQAKPKRFRGAGKWLDECCSEKSYRNRIKEKLEDIEENRQIIPDYVYESEKKSLEAKLENGRVPSVLSCFGEVRRELFEKYKDEVFISVDVARRVLLIAWLLSDPDAEQKNLGIAELEKWPWEPIDDVTKMSRGFASDLFRQNLSDLSLVRRSWEKVGGGRTGSKIEWLKKNWWWLLLVVPIVITIIGWFVQPYLEMHLRTKTYTLATKVPEINETSQADVKHPKTTIDKDIQKPRTEPDEKIKEVHQSQIEPIPNKNDISIRPDETEGEINRPKKGELKKIETSITPDENEGEVRKTK